MEKNEQIVYFQIDNKWYESTIDLKKVYSSVHKSVKYGSSANLLVNEMLANLLELAIQQKVVLNRPFVITDYGCGRSKASNLLAELVAENTELIATLLNKGTDIGEIIRILSPKITELDAKEITALDSVMHYKHITVQRYDLGIPEFSAKPTQRADVVFCNDVMEHIPEMELPNFIKELETAGKYVVASISLRDAVNYMAVSQKDLMAKACPLTQEPKQGGIVLKRQNSCNDFIFSLHVSVFPKEKWQGILGNGWTLLDAQDYTACSAMNFDPSEEYKNFKRELIAQIGFADFIPFPTKLGSRYEKDPILWERTALMQPEKHLRKLNVLEEYPDSAFKNKEKQESLDFLTYIGAKIQKDNGKWNFVSYPSSPVLLSILSALEKTAKSMRCRMLKSKKMQKKLLKQISYKSRKQFLFTGFILSN